MGNPETHPPQDTIAEEYESVDDFNTATKNVAEGRDNDMYKRYSSKKINQHEKKFAEMIGVPDTALFNAGMAAIHTAIEAEGLNQNDTIMCSNEVYGVTKEYVTALEKKGIKVIFFDPEDTTSLKTELQKNNPRLIIAETVANSKEMKVVDIKKYAEMISEQNKIYTESLNPQTVLEKFISVKESLKNISEDLKSELLTSIEEFKEGNNFFVFRDVIRKTEIETGLPRKEAIEIIAKAIKNNIKVSREKLSMILDNTLPSPVLSNPINEVGDENIEFTVVESGTKHYQDGKNKITSGIAYSSDPEKIKKLKELRIQNGTYLQPTSEKEIPEDITEKMDTNLKNHSRNALQLAKLLESQGFTVYHPNLESHDQNELANELAPDGLVTLFYVDLPNEIKDRDGFMDKVKNIGGDKIGLGSSFGHSKTWLSNFDVDSKTIRIAVGNDSEEEFHKTLDIFKQAI